MKTKILISVFIAIIFSALLVNAIQFPWQQIQPVQPEEPIEPKAAFLSPCEQAGGICIHAYLVCPTGYEESNLSCEKEPWLCIDLWQPVCGIDGKTYSNDCYAKRVGVEIACQGECPCKIKPRPSPLFPFPIAQVITTIKAIQPFQQIAPEQIQTAKRCCMPRLRPVILIDGCTSINNSGSYLLTKDLYTNKSCIKINADNVILNCNNHLIKGDSIGFAIESSKQDNLSIKSCIASKWFRGFYFFGVNDLNLLDNNVTNSDIGIYIDESSNVELTENKVSLNGEGIYLYNLQQLFVTRNKATNNLVGITLEKSSNGVIDSNFVCNNSGRDFDFWNNLFISWHNNTCSIAWNETGFINCTHPCPPEGYLNVATLKQEYQVGEKVDLTDPPEAGATGTVVEPVEEYHKLLFDTYRSPEETEEFYGIPKRKRAIPEISVEIALPEIPVVSEHELLAEKGQAPELLEIRSIAKENIFMKILKRIQGRTYLLGSLGECSCDSCSSCMDALNDDSCTKVKLSQNINSNGHCIYEPKKFSNKTFDCQSHTISGNRTGFGIRVWRDAYFGSISNVTIKNCIVTNFSYGIYLSESSNSVLINNTAKNNYWYGIYLKSDSNNNTLIKNTAENNGEIGIYLSESSNNVLINNTADSNLYGIYLGFHSNNNTLTSNTAKSNTVIGVFLKENSNNNLLTGNIANSNGQGIRIRISSNNNILENNIVSNNKFGILFSSSNNTLTNNTAKNNEAGIYISSPNNTLKNNSMDDNIFNFVIGGCTVSDYHQDIDTSNKVNGKPMYYYNGNCDSFAVPQDAGFVGLISCNNIIVKNLTLTDNYYGVLLVNTTDSVIANNLINNNGIAVCLSLNSSNNTIVNNIAKNNDRYGIYIEGGSNNKITNNLANDNKIIGVVLLLDSSNNILINNTINSNMVAGIYIYSSPNNMLKRNSMNDNIHNFVIGGNSFFENGISGSVLDYHQDIDASNRVNGKPMYYYNGNCDSFAVPQDAGFVGLVSCNNITVKDLTLTDNYYGVLLVNTTDSVVTGNTLKNNFVGINLINGSNNNILTGNIANNNYFGVFLYFNSNNNNIVRNKVNNNYWNGITFLESSNNNIANNIAKNTDGNGIALSYGSDNNMLTGNIANNNSQGGIYIGGNSNNTLTNNIASNNNYGVYLIESQNNNIADNILNNNLKYGIQVWGIREGIDFKGNIFSSNDLCTNEGNYDIYDSGNSAYSDNYCGEGRVSIAGQPGKTSCDNFCTHELPKSLINNTGSTPISGYLLLKVQKKTYTPPMEMKSYQRGVELYYWWKDKAIIVNDLSMNNLRTIPAYQHLALDTIWAEHGSWVANEKGTFRVYAALLDSQGKVIETAQGKLEDSYEFKVS